MLLIVIVHALHRVWYWLTILSVFECSIIPVLNTIFFIKKLIHNVKLGMRTEAEVRQPARPAGVDTASLSRNERSSSNGRAAEV